MAKKNKSKQKPKKNSHDVTKLKKRKLGLAKFAQQKTYSKNKNDEAETDKFPTIKPKETIKKRVVSKTNRKDLSLVEKCKLQMSSSMLRMIDEDLYRNSSTNVPLDRSKFLAYHEAYDSVQEKWPTKPIDYIVKYIKKRLIKSKPVHLIKFADIGCGKLPLLKMKLPSGCKVASFDIVSAHKDVKEANMANLPIKDESIGCAVYSLSLMARELGDIILECKRVLKLGGSMLIVEVTSRFEKKEKVFMMKMEKLGFKLKSSVELEPNGYFTFFHFTKINSELDYSGSYKNIQLKPCVYKAR